MVQSQGIMDVFQGLLFQCECMPDEDCDDLALDETTRTASYVLSARYQIVDAAKELNDMMGVQKGHTWGSMVG